MEGLLIGALIVVLLVRWAQLRDRLRHMEQRLDQMQDHISALGRQIEWARRHGEFAEAKKPEPAMAPEEPVAPPLEVKLSPPGPPPPIVPSPMVPAPAKVEAPPPASPPPPSPPPVPAFLEPQPTHAARTSEEWEALVGGNWAIKAGVFILVIGLATVLTLYFARMTPAERVLLGVAAGLTMLISGVLWERRERYRTFGRGLVGGGWATLYFTVYAAQAVEAAKVIDSPMAGALLLLAVGAGMVLHSLRYRSETVTAIAYFLSFATLAITHVAALSVIALIPLAASLLYLCHRFEWRNMALVGLAATYGTSALQPDSGAPLWEAQAIFTIYWLLFEGFDILHPGPGLLLLMNAVGFLGLSAAKWHASAPGREWQIVAASGLAYLASTIARARRGEWRVSVTLAGALAAGAIFLELNHQWVALALLIEAELYYVAGLVFGSRYLRLLAAGTFTLQLGDLLAANVPSLPYRAWTPVAALNAVVFYVNRALRPADIFYGYAGSAMVALVAGYEAWRDRGLAWFALATGSFLVGWLRRLDDFRYQGYGLAALGLIGMAVAGPEPAVSLSIAGGLAYAAVVAALRSADDRLPGREALALRWGASLAASGLMAALLWRLTPDAYRGLAWMLLALALFELGMHDLPRELKRQAYVVAAMGAVVTGIKNVLPIENSGAVEARLIPAWAALAAYALAARARKEEGESVLLGGTLVGTFFAMAALWALLPSEAVGPAWAALALLLVETRRPILRWEVFLVSAAVFGRLWMSNLEYIYRLIAVAPVAASHYYLYWRTRWRSYLYTAGVLAAALIYYQAGRRYTALAWAASIWLLFALGRRWWIRDLCWQSYAVAAAAFAACWAWNFAAGEPVLPAALVVGWLYVAQLQADRASRPRLYFLVASALLLAGLLYYRVSGSMLTVAWGLEGIALLIAGFPLGDRNQRLGGLSVLAICILKLFFWDLRTLDRMSYALSLIALGAILVAVSWIYNRFRERVRRYL
jgi:Predicted membrane protein (DUF2339)